ncbi:hypothetical protein T03_2134 [Trichinella britovi]|uniref:Uncharacterized protein n=1 Tax=Trichinella britovi TaxID=45882 RepID=A0A0V1C306_TRIBR|nr:hypothetical protein T03_2134 [Trichinella britovi]
MCWKNYEERHKKAISWKNHQKGRKRHLWHLWQNPGYSNNGIHFRVNSLFIAANPESRINQNFRRQISEPTPFVDVDRRLLSQTNDAHLMTSNSAMSTAE